MHSAKGGLAYVLKEVLTIGSQYEICTTAGPATWRELIKHLLKDYG